LHGSTEKEQSKQWAGDLARNTEGVVAVVNHIQAVPLTVWDFSPAWDELSSLGRGLIRAIPLIVLGGVTLVIAGVGAKITAYTLRWLERPKVQSRLLRDVTARGCAILVFLIGLYLVLRFSGLTRLAVSVIGGTGLIGLVLGIAFREISENFLASLFLSLQRPFREADLVEIAGHMGYIQRLTSRTTVLMTLDGNQVQIPNATVFKSTIRNFTSNPSRREDFVVGIGYLDSIPHAQDVAMKVLVSHSAILSEPEPWVLVDSLGAATVNLRVYFWLDGSRHSWLKVKSSVIRLVKRAFQDEGISLPDEARKVTFPEGVTVRLQGNEVESDRAIEAPSMAREPEVVSTSAEAGLQSDAKQIERQASQAWSPDRGENLLRSPPKNDGDTT
jgi:small-conductance mechanosensitive channel